MKSYLGVIGFVGVFFAGVYLAPILKNKSLPLPTVVKQTVQQQQQQQQPQAATNKQDCLGSGGQWIMHDTPNAKYKCDPPTKDAGKACTDSSQCEAYCVTSKVVNFGTKTTGECSRYHEYISIQTVHNGIAQPVAVE
jgi:hypothetical protein